MKKCRKYSTGVFLGRKFSYFAPAGGSGKKNLQTPISILKKFTNSNFKFTNSNFKFKKIYKPKSLREKFDKFSKLCYTVNRKVRITFLFTKLC